jgi:hypothetical protein
MRIVSEKTGVRTTTVYSWRERVSVDASWRPSKENFSEKPQIFPDDVEQTIANFLRMNFLAQARPIGHPRLQSFILILVRDLAVLCPK